MSITFVKAPAMIKNANSIAAGIASATPNSAALARKGALTIQDTVAAIIIGLVVIAVGAVVVASGFGTTKVSRHQSELNQIALNTRSVFGAGMGNYDGLTQAIAVQAGVYPGSMPAGSGTERLNPWNLPVDVREGSSPDRFLIESQGIPRESCSRIASNQITDTSANSSLLSMTINGTAIPRASLNSAAVVAACNTDTNTIILEMR